MSTEQLGTGLETVVDSLTHRLQQAIIAGVIKPRERIRVAELERKFRVSHIPIREALRRLQSEGFVEISPAADNDRGWCGSRGPKEHL
jgi:DNA-binding GntR family transcriptional regulator